MHKKNQYFRKLLSNCQYLQVKVLQKRLHFCFLKAGIFVHFYPKSNKADPKAGVSFEWSHH